MFFSSAYAQTAAAGGDIQSIFSSVGLPILMMLGVFYFLVFRPQQQRVKDLKSAQSALRRGDKIVTAGGVIGQITRVINDDEIEVQIAEGVKVRIVKTTISTVLAKSDPAPKDSKPADAKSADTGAGRWRRRRFDQEAPHHRRRPSKRYERRCLGFQASEDLGRSSSSA